MTNRPPIIAIANQKGGVGKTTTAVRVAQGLARPDAPVLLIDLDPQGNATTALGASRRGSGTYEAVVEGAPLEDLIVTSPTPGVDCVPASLDLAGAEVELVAVADREYQLVRALAADGSDLGESGSVYPRGYTAIVLDCPPSLGLLTVNALAAADSVLIPVQCEYFALDGLTHLLRTIALVREHLQPDLDVLGLLLTMYEPGSMVSAQVAEEVRAYFGDLVLDAVVPRARAQGESSTVRGIPGSAPGQGGHSAVSEAYAAASDQLAGRLAARRRVGAAEPNRGSESREVPAEATA